MTYLKKICYLNSLCIRKSITLVFMSSSKNKFMLLSQNSVTDVSVGFRPPCWCPSGLDCKTVVNFLKISTEIRKAWRKSYAREARASHARSVRRRLSPVSLSVFSLVPDLMFDCSRLLEYAKIRFLF